MTEAEASSRGDAERGNGQGNGNGSGDNGGNGGGERRRGRGYAALDPGFQTDVPAHPYDAILVDPTPTSIAISVVAYRHGDVYVTFAPKGTTATTRTPTQHLHDGETARFALQSLRPDTAYRWQLWTRAEGSKDFVAPADRIAGPEETTGRGLAKVCFSHFKRTPGNGSPREVLR